MRSARIHTLNVVRNCRMIAVGVSCTRDVACSISQPSAGPTARLPATASAKVGATVCSEKLLAATAPTARR